MSWQQWLMSLIFVLTLAGLVKYQRRGERVFAAATLACLGLSFVDVQTLLNNAANAGLVTLILLVCCSFALERTRFLRKLSNGLLTGSAKGATLKTLSLSALASAFLNNTAVVATLMAPIKNSQKLNPGKLLLPLSYAAILGGTLTLAGTSTNLIVNSLVIEQGLPGIDFFAFTPVALVALVCCFAVIVLRLGVLPEQQRDTVQSKDYFVEAKVMADSALVGKTVEAAGLRNLDALFLVEILRGEQLISPVTPEDVIAPGDHLIFSGDVAKVLVLQQFPGLALFAEQDQLLQRNLTEVLVKPDSVLVGKTLKSAGFRALFDAAVVAVRREGERLSGKLGTIEIRPGDFLVLAVGKDFVGRSNLSKNFHLLSGVTPDDMLTGWRDKLTLGGFVAAIAGSVIFDVALVKTLIFYLSALLAAGCLSAAEVKRRFPLSLWLMVVSALTLASALSQTGVAQLVSDTIGHHLAGQSQMWALVGIFLLTLLLTELITNNAAAVLLFPIAYNIALGLNVDPMPFIMAVAFAASGSFISPYGYQTNVMVYSAGNYRLQDFVRFGLPVTFVYALVMMIMIPLVFPF